MILDFVRQQLADEIKTQIDSNAGGFGVTIEPERARRLADRIIDLVVAAATAAAHEERGVVQVELEHAGKAAALPWVLGGLASGVAVTGGMVYFRRRQLRQPAEETVELPSEEVEPLAPLALLPPAATP